MSNREWNRVLLNSSAFALDELARTFFAHPRAHVDFRDGTLYTGTRWADEDEEAGFRRWVTSIERIGG